MRASKKSLQTQYSSQNTALWGANIIMSYYVSSACSTTYHLGMPKSPPHNTSQFRSVRRFWEMQISVDLWWFAWRWVGSPKTSKTEAIRFRFQAVGGHICDGWRWFVECFYACESSKVYWSCHGKESHKHCLAQIIGLPLRYKSMHSTDWRAAITAFASFQLYENHWQISIQIDAHAKCSNEHTGIASEHQCIPSTLLWNIW